MSAFLLLCDHDAASGFKRLKATAQWSTSGAQQQELQNKKAGRMKALEVFFVRAIKCHPAALSLVLKLLL